jgi:hypothetical protein
MWRKSTADETIVQYLLGRLPDAVRDDFEDRYFSDDALHEQVLAVEEELIDAYVTGELDGRDKAFFESQYLETPAYREKLAFAKALTAPGANTLPAKEPVVSGASVRPRWDWRSLFMSSLFGGFTGRVALAGVAIAAIVILFATGRFWGGRSPEPRTLLTVVLMPATRGEGNPAPSIPPGTDRVTLDLVLKTVHYRQYRVAVETADGVAVTAADNLPVQPSRTNGNVVEFIMPSSPLHPGEYVVKLSGVAPDGSAEIVAGYVFQVSASQPR